MGCRAEIVGGQDSGFVVSYAHVSVHRTRPSSRRIALHTWRVSSWASFQIGIDLPAHLS